jgi:hypothetical protein
MQGKGVASANMALSAITDKHRMAKLQNPCKDEHGTIALIMEGIKKETGKPSVQAEGLSKACLKGLINVAIGKHLDGKGKASMVMWREAWRELACFSAIARFSDINRLKRKDVFIEGEAIRLVFNVRKNDQHHKTHTAFLMPNGTRYCPVKITKLYLDLLPQDPEGFMIPDLSLKSAYTKVATYSACRRLQKSLLRKLGLDPGPFGLHSARVGAMKYMENADISVPDMAYIAGYAEGSDQPTHYAKTAMGKFLKAARKLTLF